MKISKKLLMIFFLIISCKTVYTQDTTATSAIFDLSLEDLMSIKVVTSAKWEQKITETSSKVVVITEKNIRERGYHDLVDLLNSQSTFQIQSQHGHWTKGGLINFQGLRSGDSGNNKILILIDGVELNDAGGEGIFLGLNSIPLNSVKQVEIVYGPNSTLYGRDAFGAMINILTKSEDDNYAGYSYGTYNSQRVYGGVSHKFSDAISGSINYYSYKSDEQDPTDISLSYKYRTVFPRPPYTNVFYRASDNKYLGIKFSYENLSLSYNRFDIETSETYGSNPNLYVTEYSTQLGLINQVLSLKYENKFSALADFSAEVNWKLNEFEPYTANLYMGDLFREPTHPPDDSAHAQDPFFAYGGRKYYYFRTKSFKYKLTNIARFSDKLTNITGLELDDVKGIPVISEGKGGEPITTEEQKSRLEHSLTNWGVFTEFNYDLDENLIVSLGGRVDDHSLNKTTFMPRAAVILNQNGHNFRLTYSTGYIAPSVTQSFFESITTFSWIKRNPNLKAEKNSAIQFDYSYYSEDIILGGGLYYNKLGDAIVESVTTGDSAFVMLGPDTFYVPVLMTQNVSSGYRYGLNLSAEKNFSEYISANLNYSLVLGKDKIYDHEIDINKNLVSNHKITFGIQWRYKFLFLYTEFIWRSGKSIKSNHITDNYALLSDANGYINFNPDFLTNINLTANNVYKGLSFYVKVRNLFNREYYGQTISAQWGSPLVLQDLRRVDAGFEFEF